jgi:hypothetical protein
MTASIDMGIMKNRIPDFDQFGVLVLAALKFSLK